VDGRRKSLFDTQIINLCQLEVKRLEATPLVRSEHQYKSWEIERGVIAYILVATALGRCHVEIDNLGVDIFSVLKGCDERTNVLERGSTDQL
jgi:hypothetical protein